MKVRDERAGTRPSISERPSSAKCAFRAEDIENRRKDVDGFDNPVHDLAASLAWQFHQQRYPKDVGEIAVLLRVASGAAFAVTPTMIGCDDDESLVVHPHCAQPQNQITEQTVHESDLRQMSLMERCRRMQGSTPSNNRVSPESVVS